MTIRITIFNMIISIFEDMHLPIICLYSHIWYHGYRIRRRTVTDIHVQRCTAKINMHIVLIILFGVVLISDITIFVDRRKEACLFGCNKILR